MEKSIDAIFPIAPMLNMSIFLLFAFLVLPP